MRLGALLVALLLLTGCSGSSPAGPAASPAPLAQPGAAPARVLMVTATAGFRHDSIAVARQAVTVLGSASGEFVVTATDDLQSLNAANLESYDVLFFALTSGELPLTDQQK